MSQRQELSALYGRIEEYKRQHRTCVERVMRTRHNLTEAQLEYDAAMEHRKTVADRLAGLEEAVKLIEGGVATVPLQVVPSQNEEG